MVLAVDLIAPPGDQVSEHHTQEDRRPEVSPNSTTDKLPPAALARWLRSPPPFVSLSPAPGFETNSDDRTGHDRRHQRSIQLMFVRAITPMIASNAPPRLSAERRRPSDAVAAPAMIGGSILRQPGTIAGDQAPMLKTASSLAVPVSTGTARTVAPPPRRRAATRY